jgi:hypothetical protein
MTAVPVPVLGGVLISVHSLAVSVPFYSDVLGLEVWLHDEQVAIVANARSGPPFLTLRESPSSAGRPGPDSLGARALFWHLPTIEALDALELRLRARDAFSRRHPRSENTEIVIGFDPDRLPLAFSASVDGSPIQLAQLGKIPTFAYGIDA